MDGLIIQIVLMSICGGISAAIANSKGRSVGGWFVGGFLLGLLGIIIVACLSNLNEQRQYRSYVDDQNRYLQEQLRQERMKSESYRYHTQARLDAHDNTLGIDTRTLGIGSLTGPDPAQQNQLGYQQGSQQGQFGTSQGQFGGSQGQFVQDIQQWYYAYNGETMGPVTTQQLVDLVRQGAVNRATLVWCSRMTDWARAEAVTELQSEFI